MLSSQRSLVAYNASSPQFDSYYAWNNLKVTLNCCCFDCLMDRNCDPFSDSDCLPVGSPFMFSLSPSTLLSQASTPSIFDKMESVRVESIGQPDDLQYSFGSELLTDFPLTADFAIENDDENNDEVKENISAESLLLSGLSCSQLSREGDSLIYSQPLSQRSQNSQQRSQENPNILQVKSLDNSLLSSSYESYSQPLVIASQSSYQGSSLYSSTHEQNGTQSLTQSSSQLSQQSQEGSCCRKHKKYFEKLANRPSKIINVDYNIEVGMLCTPTHNGYLKPPFSHNMLCALAICSEPTQQQEVSGVYRFLTQCFPYFEDAGQHWKNSLRHSLATCDWFEKSEQSRTAKKGFKYGIRLCRKKCLKCEIKKQCVIDITKLHYRLADPYVCEHLINMGLLALNPHKMAELKQAMRAHANQTMRPAIQN